MTEPRVAPFVGATVVVTVLLESEPSVVVVYGSAVLTNTVGVAPGPVEVDVIGGPPLTPAS